MINTVAISNFKCLREVRIELERFTVFVGANGSGKTSVLEAIHQAARAATGDPNKVFAREWHGDWIYTRGGTGALSISCTTAQGEFGVEGTPSPVLPNLDQNREWHFRVFPEVQTSVVCPVRTVGFHRLNATMLGKPSYSAKNPPCVEAAGEGLASVLAFMALNDPAGFGELVDLARTMIPRLRGIRFRKATVHRNERELVKFGKETVERRMRRPYLGELLLFDFDQAENVSARTASEGALLSLGFLAVLLGPARPQILLLDDIEQGLHPLAQKRLVEVIGKVMQQSPQLQVVATTHSPYLLNYVEPEQVRVMARGCDGFARCGRLMEHPRYLKWKDELAPGEMWSFFGEGWLVEQGAVA